MTADTETPDCYGTLRPLDGLWCLGCDWFYLCGDACDEQRR